MIVDRRGTSWHDVAGFVNMRLVDAGEHLSATEVQKIAEKVSNVRYDRLAAAAVARAWEK